MENEKTCRDCKHYRRHYVDIEGRYHEIHDGHCVYPRVKRKRAEDLLYGELAAALGIPREDVEQYIVTRAEEALADDSRKREN